MRHFRVGMLAIFALCLLSVSVNQAAGCVYHNRYDEGDGYVNLGGRNYVNGTFRAYTDGSCQTPLDFSIRLSRVAYAGSQSAAWAICEANVDEVSFVWEEAPNFWQCHTEGGPGVGPTTINIRVLLGPVYRQPDSGSALSACRARYPQSTHVESFAPQFGGWACWYIVGQFAGFGGGGGRRGFLDVPNIPMQGLRVRGYDGSDSGIQFRRLTQYYVGIQSVLDMGVLDVVDVWSNVGSGYEVCFPLPGRVILLDAATSPRTVTPLNTYIVDGHTCAESDRAGTMVLVKAETETAPAPTSTNTRRPGTNDSVDTAIGLENCVITTRSNLRVRSAPWGQILAVIPGGTTVEAEGRTQSWFQVTYGDKKGWIAAWLADGDDHCDWQ